VYLTDVKQHGLCRIDAAGAAVLAVVSLIGCLTTVGPLLEQQAVTARRHDEMQTQQGKASELKAAIATVKERLETVRLETAGNSVQLEAGSHINRRIAGLTASLSKCGLDVDDVKTGPICSSPRYDLVPITITGRGTYRQSVSFFRGLCSTFRDMSVMQIELSGHPARSEEPEQFRFDLFWYAAPGDPVRNASSERPSDGVVPRS
jgi:Tfp pilus assembly protein PilO